MTVDEDFERELVRGLRDLVGQEHPPPELRERLADAIHEPPSPRRAWAPAVAAALLVVLVLGAVLAQRNDDAVEVDLASEPAANASAEVSAPTTAAPAPAVAPPSTVAEPTAPDDDADAETTVSPTTVAASTPAPAPRPTPSTTVPCRNSTDPACGPFRWDPEPSNRPATLSISMPPGPIVSGEQIELTISMSDPDGAVTLECYSVDLDRPGLSTGACSVSNPDNCPDRYGSWEPPPPKAQRAETTTIVQFEETGTYELTVDVSPADGCDHVDPYRSGAKETITVEVVAPPPAQDA